MTLSILFYIDFKGALFSFDLQQGSPKVVTVGALLSLLCNDDGGHKKSAVTLHVVATICFHAMIVSSIMGSLSLLVWDGRIR